MNDTTHIIRYRTLVTTWLVLLALTALTIAITRLELGEIKIWGALAVATLKSALVIAVFMHMRHEGQLLRWLLFVALLTLAVFIGFTFFDVSYR